MATALDLGLRGIKSVLIEQFDSVNSILMCKAGGGINERTLEIFRRWGISDGAMNWGAPDDYPVDTLYCTSVFGYRIGLDRSTRPKGSLSPERLIRCPQTVLIPLLTKAALATGNVSIRYNTKFLGFKQDAEGVTVDAAEEATEKTSQIRAEYMVGCDGATSNVREILGIPYLGKTLDYSVSIVLRIKNFGEYTGMKTVERFMFVGPGGTWANISSMDYLERWRLVLLGSKTKMEIDQLDIPAIVEKAIGRTDARVEVVNVIPWRRNERVADTFKQGRVLLAGDAAHAISPTGGHGLNTGFGDVVTLGWMLAGVLDGWASPDILEAYTAERRPVAVRNSLAATKSYSYWVGKIDFSKVLVEGPEGIRARERIGKELSAGLSSEWNSLGVVMGYRFEGSPLIVPDGSPEPADEAETYIPTARPGHRLPHAWLPDGRSTIDLFGNGYVLLRLGSNPVDVTKFMEEAKKNNLPLTVVDIPDSQIHKLYERRLVLARPDGHSAWRGDAVPENVRTIVQTCKGMFVRAAVA